MKKPFFTPPVQFDTRPDLPEDPVEAARLIDALRENVASSQLRSAQMQQVHDEGSLVRLGLLIRAKIYFQNHHEKT